MTGMKLDLFNLTPPSYGVKNERCCTSVPTICFKAGAGETWPLAFYLYSLLR